MTEINYHPSDCRPVSSRDLKIIQWMANFLATRKFSANSVSVLGCISALCACVCLVSTNLTQWPEIPLWIAAAIFVQGRLLANVLDGMIAIAQGKASKVGELYNEVPDRISDTVILVGLGYAVNGSVELGYLAALLAMFTAYIRAMGKAAGAQQQFGGPMAKQHRMFVVTLAALLCAALPVQTICFAGYCQFGIPTLALFIITVGSLITALRRLLRISKELQS